MGFSGVGGGEVGGVGLVAVGMPIEANRVSECWIYAILTSRVISPQKMFGGIRS